GRRRRKSSSPLLVRKLGAANGYTFAPERYSPATFAGDTACSHHCCRSAGLADSRTSRQTSRYQAQRVFEPNQEWCVLSNGGAVGDADGRAGAATGVSVRARD